MEPKLAPNTEQAPAPARLLPLRGLLSNLEADAVARYDAKQSGRPRGALTGFSVLDNAIGGYIVPGLHFLHGSPGSGKTAFALQIAASCGCPCLYVTCEMSPLELLRRHIARVTQTYLGKFKSGELNPGVVMDYARRAVHAAPDLAFLDATTAPVITSEIASAAATMREGGDGNAPGHLLLIVDSLHAWAGAGDAAASEYDTLNAGISGLRGLASRLDAPLLAIVERNRAGMKDAGLHTGAGTRKIEYGAETVIGLDAGEENAATNERPVTLTISKNRHGTVSAKPLRLLFNGGFQSFRTDTMG